MVRSYYEVAALAGLKVVALDYIGNAMLQLIKTQTSENMTTMVIQLGSESTVLNIVKEISFCYRELYHMVPMLL